MYEKFSTILIFVFQSFAKRRLYLVSILLPRISVFNFSGSEQSLQRVFPADAAEKTVLSGCTPSRLRET